jgi:hypothetical protein
MSPNTALWFSLTPKGALRAFGQPEPDESARQLQALLASDFTLDLAAWRETTGAEEGGLLALEARAWVQRVQRRLQGPDARLDDFVLHVIAPLSSERKVALASDAGFCLGRSGFDQDEAELLCAAAADFGNYAARQARRGWDGANGFIAFHSDPEFLLPNHAFVPFWVDGTGYWLVIAGEPLLNSPALVELLWGIKAAGSRFLLPD